MMRNAIAAVLFTGLIMGMSAQSGDLNELAIGDKAPSANMKVTNIDGQEWSLVDLAGENGVLVIFSCNTCPFVVGREGKSDGWEGNSWQQ